MMSKLQQYPLPKQLGVSTLFFVSITFIVLMTLINQLFNTKINDIVTTHQLTETELFAKQLSEKYYSVEESLTHHSTFIKDELTAIVVTSNETSNQNGIKLPILNYHGEVLNGNSHFLDNFSKAVDAEVNLIYRQNGTFYRIASSSDAFPVTFNPNNPAYTSLQSNTSFFGQVSLSDKKYLVSYDAISGQGNLYIEIATSFDFILAPIKEYINNKRFGKSGYMYVSDAAINKGELVIHPSIEGQNLFEVDRNNQELNDAFHKMFQSDKGVVSYTLQIAGQDETARSSKAVFTEVPGWNWVVTLKSYNDEYREEVQGIIWTVSAIAAAASLILSALLWLLIRKALFPLRDISNGLSQLGKGNLAFRFAMKANKKSQNEIHILQRDAIIMRDSLTTLVEKVQQSSVELLESAGAISTSNKDLRDSASHSENASIQVSSSITQIAASIEEVSSNTIQVSDESISVRKSTEEGHVAVQTVGETVRELSTAFSKASDTISSVENSSKSIGEVVNVINAIAEQTNLLALNAAIEAARAGEQGRGFAVVADEVRVLAQRTQLSTEQIQEVVETLQKNSHYAVKEMEQGRSQVDESIRQVAEAENMLSNIYQSIQTVEANINNVAATTEEQSVASTEIGQNAQALQAASTDTLKQADISQRHSNNIRAVAEDLQSNLSVFKLK